MKAPSKLQLAVSSAAITAVLCFALLACISLDCEKYEKEDSVPVSITYPAPEKPREEGFWDIFSKAVVSLFKIEA